MGKTMVKVVNPCVCSTYHADVYAYAKIEYEDGGLSICGVVGPKRNGDCTGSAGQCVDEIRNGKPTEDWTNEMLQKFCDIWERWHLNDMRPYCKHQRELGWVEQSQEKVKVMKWDRTKETWEKARAAEKRAVECLKKGKTFVPTPEETIYANVSYGVTTYNDELPEHPEFYEFKERDCLGHSNVEYKTRGWISHKEHPLGILGKPCPVCGYEYGSSWIKEEVPQDVIDWLFSLPESRTKPAWV
ncbi:hypothetical protein EDD74_11939 [Faecalimonas umbilicata]|uniref:Uncharacterized protein n=1 Tax=Faecalimonas umbilicata TaxID=1912855 RepID=A0A4R3JMA2_9FIRM|nr:hypothetical protein [Faecalimonas umbilicata]TCS66141.1 hypothetical protein EDD74_11939 [Faecalimonas umbilicata]GBU06539.1 hypothetical protein FAEUMB_30800 [Faecalimonas umbilicata]